MKIINFFKSFLGLLIFFSIQLLTSYIILKFNLNNFSLIYILMETIIAILLIFLYFDKIKNDFFDFDKNYKKYLKIAFKVYFIGLFVMLISNLIINKFIIVDNMAYNEEIDRLLLFKYPLFSVIAMIITGPFIEETSFRLGFKKYINNKYLYYILATFIFTSVHVFNGLSNPLELLYFIPYGSLSFAFTYILDKTDNIFSSTIIHLFHNTISILLILYVSLVGV